MSIRSIRNEHLSKLAGSYLFPVIAKRKAEFLKERPDAKLISMGMGDTTQPLPQVIADSIANFAKGMATPEGYCGYHPPIQKEVATKISQLFYPPGAVKPDEVFMSDGSKCDLARLQQLWSSNCKVALQDPAYPVYVDDTVIAGRTGNYNSSTGFYDGICYMPCNAENNFFPDLSVAENCDILVFCNPNNPTGAVADRAQLETLVKFCSDRKILLLYDAAYARYITDPNLPRSIFEIDGARKIAIETNSFSKLAGFTGMRLGWTVIPDEVEYQDGRKLKDDFSRIWTTHFMGAPVFSLAGGLAALNNLDVVDEVIDYYRVNTQKVLQTCKELNWESYGGEHCPYVFVKFPGRKSWDVFEELLTRAEVVVTPGVGFGRTGEGYVRLSAYGSHENIEEACRRFKEHL